MMTVSINALPVGDEIVTLWRDAELIGGWHNVGENKAADIAAEVIKTSFPGILVVYPAMEHLQDAGSKYWAAVKVFKLSRDFPGI